MIEAKKPTRNSLFWRLWLRALTVKRAQTGVALVSLLLGAATVSMLTNLYNGVRRKMTQEFRTYGANIVVAPVGSSAYVRSAPAPVGLMDEKAALGRLQEFGKRLPGLIAVPRLDVVIRIARVPGESQALESVNAVAVGTDFASLLLLNAGWQILGSTDALDSSACAVGEHVASRLGLRIGDAIEVDPIRPGAGQVAPLEQALSPTGSDPSKPASNQSDPVCRVS